MTTQQSQSSKDSTTVSSSSSHSLKSEYFELKKKYKSSMQYLEISTIYFIFIALVSLVKSVVSFFGLDAWLKAHLWEFLYDIPSGFYHFYENTHAFHDVLLGINGILIGVFIALMLEVFQREKDDELGKKNEALHSNTENIRNAVESLKEIIGRDIKVIENYEELLGEIGAVIDHASKADGDLLIMNLSASFGYYLTFDCDTVLKLKPETIDTDHIKHRIEQVNKHTGLKYHALHDELLSEQRVNEEKLRACMREKVTKRSGNNGAGKVKYLTLDPNGKNGEPAPLITKYLDPSLKDARVEFYDSASEQAMQLSVVGADEKTKLFLVPLHHLDPSEPTTEQLNHDDRLELFKTHLVNSQKRQISHMRNANIEVTELAEVPFQMYLSIPNESRYSGRGVFMFVNQYTLSKTNYIAAFRTKDRVVLETFKAIFESVKGTTPSGIHP